MPLDAPDTAASSLADHAFEAECWWERCAHCGLSMAAHKTARLSVYKQQRADTREQEYRCPYCVDRRQATCPHGRARARGIDMKPLNPGGNNGQPPEDRA